MTSDGLSQVHSIRHTLRDLLFTHNVSSACSQIYYHNVSHPRTSIFWFTCLFSAPPWLVVKCEHRIATKTPAKGVEHFNTVTWSIWVRVTGLPRVEVVPRHSALSVHTVPNTCHGYSTALLPCVHVQQFETREESLSPDQIQQTAATARVVVCVVRQFSQQQTAFPKPKGWQHSVLSSIITALPGGCKLALLMRGWLGPVKPEKARMVKISERTMQDFCMCVCVFHIMKPTLYIPNKSRLFTAENISKYRIFLNPNQR